MVVEQELRYRAYGAAEQLLFDIRAPEVLIEGPAGTGKTRAVLEFVNMCCELYDGIRVLLVRQTRKSMTESVLVTWEQNVLWPGHPCITGKASRSTRQSYTYPNGSHIVLGGMDNPDRIMSTEYDLICFFEATEGTLEGWEKLTSRNRNNVMPFQMCIADCNPAHATHWLNQRPEQTICCEVGCGKILKQQEDFDKPLVFAGEACEDHPDGEARVRMVRILSRHEDNPSVTEEYLQKLDALTGPRKARLRDGLWISEEGQIYEAFDSTLHMIPASKVPPCRWYFGSIDWGFRNPGVFQVWGVDHDSRMYRVAEVYHARRQHDWWADRICELDAEYNLRAIVADPADPDAIAYLNDRICDFRGRSSYRIVRKADNRKRDKTKKERVGFDLVRWGLEADETGRPKLFLVRDALLIRDSELSDALQPTCTEQEIPGYVFYKHEDGRPDREEPDPLCPDHGCDAMRYAAMFAWRRDLSDAPELPPHDEESLGGILGHDPEVFEAQKRMAKRKAKKYTKPELN